MIDQAENNNFPSGTPTPPVRREASPWAVFFTTLAGALVGFTIIGPFIGLIIAFPFYDGQLFDYLADVAAPVGKPSMKTILLIVQGAATFIGLAVVPTMLWRSMTQRKVKTLFEHNKPTLVTILMAVGIVIFFIGPNSFFIELNSKMDLPDGAFETWARDIEDRAGELTKYLTSFPSFAHYLFGVLVIAILPGLGEELVFRGYIQPALHKATNNAHIGIWVSAILFSALHMQFYGFVPRVLLGAVFGYLYLWSGNLWVPIIAHFVNNCFAVTMIYLGLSELPGMELENPESMPWYAVLPTSAIFGVLMYQFYIRRKPVIPQ